MTGERGRAEAALRESEAKYRALFDSIDQGFCIIEVLFDETGKAVDYIFREANPAFETQTGVGDAVGKRMRDIAPKHEEFWFETYGRIALTGRPERFEHRAEALGRWYDVYAFRIGEPEDRRVAILFYDIIDRKGAEEALRASEERYRLIVENARYAAIFTMDPDGIVTDWHEGARKAFGYSRDEIVGRDGEILWTREDRAAGEPVKEMETAARTGKADNVRWHLRKDGRRVFIEGVTTALHDAQGGLTGFLKVGLDATERRLGEEHERMLLAELQHRVRNTLAIVRSIAHRTAERSNSVAEFIGHFDGRLNAFSRVQSAVTRNPEAGIDLESLVEDELLAVAAQEGRQLNVEGPPVKLKPRAAEALSLAIHELATNAVKYGALGSRKGRIDISWRRVGSEGAERLELQWTESGLDGLEAPEREGFGHEMLRRSLPYDLHAETRIEFDEQGLRFSMNMPLGARIVSD